MTRRLTILIFRPTVAVSYTHLDVYKRQAEAVRDKVSETIQAQAQATADAVEERLRQVDWKAEATKGAEGGLRWLSKRLEVLAERLRGDSKQ